MKQSVKITVILFAVFFFSISAVCWFSPSKDYSVTERRKLEQMPEISAETVSNGKFMKDFEQYTLDQFPFRDAFRNLKGWVSGNIFGKADNNGIYVYDDFAVKMEYPLNASSIENALNKFQKLYNQYLKESGRIYLSVIPDKNFYLAEKSGHLSMDYDRIFQMMQEGMPYAEYIDITGMLEIEDYYKTDVHWRQEQLEDVARYMADRMTVKLGGVYEKKVLENEFYGVYFGQSALNLPGETLFYLTNDVMEQCRMKNYENNRILGMYDMEKAVDKDPYEMFLSGPVSLLTIENPLSDTDRELIVFRDSFGSSLIPLFAEGYAKITLIDIRYIQRDFLANFVDFADKDVLFLYSTTVLNHSETFK